MTRAQIIWATAHVLSINMPVPSDVPTIGNVEPIPPFDVSIYNANEWYPIVNQTNYEAQIFFVAAHTEDQPKTVNLKYMYGYFTDEPNPNQRYIVVLSKDSSTVSSVSMTQYTREIGSTREQAYSLGRTGTSISADDKIYYSYRTHFANYPDGTLMFNCSKDELNYYISHYIKL